MQEANLLVRDEYLIGGGVQTEDGQRGGHQLLNATPAPTAIIVSNNKLLLGLFQTIEELKIQVPEQISIVGFDDYAWNHYVNPRLTVVAQDTNEMGRQAFGLLLELMTSNSDGMPIKQIRLKTELIVRNSTAPPAPVLLVKTRGRRIEA
jgi:DNA-binding LacI/PurR family transcriptional regulator